LPFAILGSLIIWDLRIGNAVGLWGKKLHPTGPKNMKRDGGEKGNQKKKTQFHVVGGKISRRIPKWKKV